MIDALPKEKYINALPLFLQSPHHAMARSCCVGITPARIFADCEDKPSAAIAIMERIGIGFAAGDPAYSEALLSALRNLYPLYLIMDPPASWHPALAAWSPQSRATVRYAFSNDPHSFLIEKLKAQATPPSGCTLLPYTRQLLRQALSSSWSRDQLGMFPSVSTFLRHGFGMALVRNGSLLSGCTSFCLHEDGYEIQVDTHPLERGKGYATCVSAAFILETIKRGKTPHWDAANHSSLRLAMKLGYVLHCAYPAWVLISPGENAWEAMERVVGPGSMEDS